jgi:Holliday junction DNA helicase RuvA
MIAHIEGRIIEKNPAYLIVSCNGVGYLLNISLSTYSKLGEDEHCKLHTHLVVREDAMNLFGFFDKIEKRLFQYLISVNGVGATTAIMILSSMTPGEIRNAIVLNNVTALQRIKGIGAKSAQRIIIDLKDKLSKEELSDEDLLPLNNTTKDEALSALVMLGFSKNMAEKSIDRILSNNKQEMNVEHLVKEVLKSL